MTLRNEGDKALMGRTDYDKLVKAAQTLDELRIKKVPMNDKAYKTTENDLYEVLKRIGQNEIGRLLARIQSNIIDGSYRLGILNVISYAAQRLWRIHLGGYIAMAKAWRKPYLTLSQNEKATFASVKTPYGPKIRVNQENGKRLLELAKDKPELSVDDVAFLKRVLKDAGWLEEIKKADATPELKAKPEGNSGTSVSQPEK